MRRTRKTNDLNESRLRANSITNLIGLKVFVTVFQHSTKYRYVRKEPIFSPNNAL